MQRKPLEVTDIPERSILRRNSLLVGRDKGNDEMYI
jgi:hypothetical protein